MTAIPTTDQILASLTDSRRPPVTQNEADDVARSAAFMREQLPDIDPAVVGRVLLHASDVFGAFATRHGRQRIGFEELAAVRLIGGAGQQMYLGDERTQG